MSMNLLLLLHVALYSMLPLCFGLLGRSLRSYAYYIYIALVLLLGGMLGPVYVLPITEFITITGGNVCFAAFWMSTILLLISQNSLDAVRSIIRLVIVVNLFLLGVYTLTHAVLESSIAVNPLNVPGELYAVSSGFLILGGLLTIAELLLVIWLGERVKEKFRNPVALAAALVTLFFIVLCLDGIFFPLIALPFDRTMLTVLAGSLADKFVLASLFSVPMLLYFVLNPDVLKRFQQAPVRLSEVFRRRSASLPGTDQREDVLNNLTGGELRELAERLSTATAAANMGIWEFDEARGTLDWDERASTIHRVEKVPGKAGIATYWASVHEADRAELRRQFEAMADGNTESVSLTYRLNPAVAASDSAVHVKLHALADRTDRGLRILGAISDVTEELQLARENEALQARVHQLQKMEAVGRFAGSIAHDFNNLLTPIIGHTELSQSQLDADNPVRQNLSEIHKAADRARNLTQQLLAFNSESTLKKQALDLSAAIEDCSSIIESLVGAKVCLEFDLVKPAMVIANQGQLDQVLMNLAANARDAIEHTGTLKFSTSVIEVSASFLSTHAGAKPGKFVQLGVADDGMGMDEATLARAFEPYYSTKEIDRGTGLGMYTIYSIVQQHDGYVWLESVQGAGTTVSILLPAYS